MNKKTSLIIVLVCVAVILIAFLSLNSKASDKDIKSLPKNEDALSVDPSNNQDVKEFSMTSFVEMVDGKPKPQYSLKDITVNKGDKVRIKITVTSGMHDFNIDEFNIHEDTQLNKESVVEFVADKSGTFTYYCSKPGHRANGHWGTLTVL